MYPVGINSTQCWGGGLLIGGGHTENLLMVVTYTTIIYSVGCVRKQPIRDQTHEHRKLISMWFRLRQRARRSGRQRKWESGHGEATRQSQLNKVLLIPSPPPHRQPQCVCVLLRGERACVCPPIYLESCDLTRAVMHSVKSPAIYSRTVLGFPAKHCRSPVVFVPAESACCCFVMSLSTHRRRVFLFICPAWEEKLGHEKHFSLSSLCWQRACKIVNHKDHIKN